MRVLLASRATGAGRGAPPRFRREFMQDRGRRVTILQGSGGQRRSEMDSKTFLQVLLAVVLIALVLSGLVLAVAFRRLRRIRLPPNADFFTTVRAVPFSLVVGL